MKSKELTDSSYKEVLNRYLHRSGSLLAARVLQFSCILLIFWLYSLRLTKDLYGSYQKIFTISSLCSALLALGLPLLIASLPQADTGKIVRYILKKTKIIYVFTYISTAVLIFILLDRTSYLTWILLLIISFTNAAYTILEVFAIKQSKDKTVLISNILYSLLFFLVHYWTLLIRPFQINHLLTGLIAISFLRICSIYKSKTIFYNQLPEKEITTEPNHIYIRQWVFLSLNETLEAFSKNIDKLFLIWLLTAPAFAIYFNGAYEIPLLGILVSVSGIFINVQGQQHNLDNNGLSSLFRKSSLLLAFLLFPLFFFVQLYAYPVFKLLFNGKYDQSIPILLVSSWIIPLRMANYTAILQSKLKSQLIFKGSTLGLACKLLLCILMYYISGLVGVATAIVVATAFQVIYYLYHTADVLKIPFYKILPFRKLLTLFLSCGIIFWITNKITVNMSALFQIATGILVMCLLSVISFLLFLKQKDNLTEY